MEDAFGVIMLIAFAIVSVTVATFEHWQGAAKRGLACLRDRAFKKRT